MNEEVRQVPVEPGSPDLLETWSRETDDPDGIRNVGADHHAAEPGEVSGWYVTIWAMEFVRDDPFMSEYRRRIADALRQVSGVTSAEEHDTESWWVTGNPSGRALVEAAAMVVDDLAARTEAYMSGDEEGVIP
jgi:hypothetical protein